MTAAAGNPEHIARVQSQVEALLRKSCYHTLELSDGTVIPGIIPVAALRHRIESYPIPADLRGKRVLDMG